jgi:hypothetical protein
MHVTDKRIIRHASRVVIFQLVEALGKQLLQDVVEILGRSNRSP